MEDSGGAPSRPRAAGGQCAYTDKRDKRKFPCACHRCQTVSPSYLSFCMYHACTDSGNKDVCGKGRLGQRSEDLETLQSSEVLFGPFEKFKSVSPPRDKEPQEERWPETLLLRLVSSKLWASVYSSAGQDNTEGLCFRRIRVTG